MKLKITNIIGTLLIIIGLCIFGYKKITKYILDFQKSDKIDIFFKNYNSEGNKYNNETDYLMVLEIPKIQLKQGIYHITDKRNNINENVTILNESILPNGDSGSLIIAAHSGNNWNSYFKNLNKLLLNDGIFIYYENKKYEYKIKKIYTKSKKSDFYHFNQNGITLITCLDDNIYLIIEAS